MPRNLEKSSRLFVRIFLIILQIQSIYIVTRLAELSGQSVYKAKHLTHHTEIPAFLAEISTRRATWSLHVDSQSGKYSNYKVTENSVLPTNSSSPVSKVANFLGLVSSRNQARRRH